MVEQLKIVSGGQTGADRAALDWALTNGIQHGGWCPKRRLAENGRIPFRYQLKETPHSRRSERTEWNVRDSDGTVIFSIEPILTGGSRKTMELARYYGRPVLHLWQKGGPAMPERRLLHWVQQHAIKALNVAGPRSSDCPGIAAFVKQVLENAFLETEPAEVSASAATKPGPIRQPMFKTKRLLLRPYSPKDAAKVAKLAGAWEIADTTIAIPHPYSKAQAKAWINHLSDGRNAGNEIVFAVTMKRNGQMIGSAGLRQISHEHGSAELGLWIAVDQWGRGYATEATRALLQFGFETLRLNRIYAHHMLRNPASGRVLARIGMKREGMLRQSIRKWGLFEDVAVMGILRMEWQRGTRT